MISPTNRYITDLKCSPIIIIIIIIRYVCMQCNECVDIFFFVETSSRMLIIYIWSMMPIAMFRICSTNCRLLNMPKP